MKIYLFIILASTILASCSNTNENEASKSKQVVYHKSYEFKRSFAGLKSWVKINDVWHLSTVNLMSNKECELIPIDSSLNSRKIDLTDLLEKVDVQAIEFYGQDTLVSLSSNSKKLFIHNDSGVIWKTVDLTPYFEGLPIYKMKFCNLNTPFKLNDSSAVFNIYYDHTNFIQEGEAPTVAQMTEMTEARLKHNALFKIENIFSDSLKVKFGGANIYNRFLKPSDQIHELYNYYLTENEILFTSLYTDSVYIINSSDLSLKSTHKIHSENGKIHANPITIQEDSLDQTLLFVMRQNAGKINSIIYDYSSQLYFVFAKHEIKNDESLKWSLIITNNKFETLHEIAMENKGYVPFGTIIPNIGVGIYEKNQDNDPFALTRIKHISYE